MIRELSFLKSNEFSGPFRPTRGHDNDITLCDDDLKDISAGPGVYIILSEDKTKFVYPNGMNSIIYIGQAKNLRRRLREHLRHLNDVIDHEIYYLREHIERCPRYQYMRFHGARVITFNCLKRTQTAKELESIILLKFYEKYRSIPVGNGARSFSLEK